MRRRTLAEQGVGVRVLNMSTIKPLDEDAILAAAEETRGIVTAEEHHLTGGLGGAVAELLAVKRPTPMRMVGMPDEFAVVGPTDKIRARYGMSARHIVDACLDLVELDATAPGLRYADSANSDNSDRVVPSEESHLFASPGRVEMRRMAVLGCTLLVVAGCGGGGSSNVEEMMQVDPAEPETGSMEPETSPTLSTLGAYQSAPIDDVGDAFTAVFHRWGVWGGILRDDAVTCQAIGCPPAGDTIFMAYMNHEIDGTVSTTTQGMQSGTSPELAAARSGPAMSSLMRRKTLRISRGRPSQPTRLWKATHDLRSTSQPFPSMSISRTSTIAGRTCLGTGLPWTHGAFGDETAGMEGSFYGADHEGAAGTFARDGLTGVFGALRSSD